MLGIRASLGVSLACLTRRAHAARLSSLYVSITRRGVRRRLSFSSVPSLNGNPTFILDPIVCCEVRSELGYKTRSWYGLSLRRSPGSGWSLRTCLIITNPMLIVFPSHSPDIARSFSHSTDADRDICAEQSRAGVHTLSYLSGLPSQSKLLPSQAAAAAPSHSHHFGPVRTWPRPRLASAGPARTLQRPAH